MKKNVLKVMAFLLVCFAAAFFLNSCSGKAKEKVVEKITLASPTNIKYDVDEGKVSWNAVSNADFYEVTFNSEAANKVSASSVKFKTEEDEFTFTIQAKSNGVYLESEVVTMTFAKLESNITLAVADNGEITWEAVAGATGYEVMIDNKTTESVVMPSFDEVTPGSQHTVKVRPVKDSTSSTYYYASWSPAVSLTVLGEVQKASIKYEDGQIKWNSVTGAKKYNVTVNGTDYEAGTNSLNFEASNSNFNVTIAAIGDHTATFDGKVSAEKRFVYLDTVTGITVENGILTWSEIENASGYQIKLKSNTNTPVSAQTNRYSGLAAGTQYNVSVLPVGEDSDVSYFANWSIAQSILILPSPDIKWTPGLDVNGDDLTNAIYWNQVQGASGYVYSVTKPNGQEVSGALGPSTVQYGDTFQDVGIYEVKVKATADGSEGIYDSAYSTPVIVKRLSAPTISANTNVTSNPSNLLSGFQVSFTGVADATGYELYKEGTKVQTQRSPQFNVTEVFEEGKTREDSYAYYVRSVGSVSGDYKRVVLSSRMGDASDSSAFTITILQTPTNPTVTGKGYGAEYSFLGVANGYGYSVNISGSAYDTSDTKYSLNSLNVGVFEVKACARGNGHAVLASDFTTSITVERINAPYNIKINCDESDGLLEFDGAQKADSYQLVITGRESAIPVDSTTNMREYITTQGTTLHMYSIANKFTDTQETYYVMTSPASTTQTFIKLETPTNINFSNTNMTWNAPSNLNSSGTVFAPNYKIINNANNAVYNGEFAGTSYPLTDLVAGSYSFGIVALGDGERFINSEKASSKEITKLETPTLTVNTALARYEWEAVIGATGYALVIDSKVVDKSSENYQGTTYYYSPTYTTIGSHKVEIYAVGDSGQTTINSSTFTYTQVVAQLTTPGFKFSYSHSSANKTDGEISMCVTNESNYPTAYVYVIGETEHKVSGASMSQYDFKPNTDSGEFVLYMYAKGGSFDDEEVYYIDSQATTTQKLVLLGYPSESTIEVSMQGQLRWSQVRNAIGYIVNLRITSTDNEEYTATITINTNTANTILNNVQTNESRILNYADIKNLTVDVQAKGNLVENTLYTGTMYVSSAIVTHTFPSDLH